MVIFSIKGVRVNNILDASPSNMIRPMIRHNNLLPESVGCQGLYVYI